MDFLKDKKILIGAAVLILVIIGGAVFLLNSKKSTQTTDTVEEEQILTLSAEEIGLTLSMAEDGKDVTMRVDNAEDITSIEYELSYNSEGDIPRGAIGTVEVKGRLIEKKITLGTCSDVCHYDENVTDVKIILKVTKTDGKIYQVEKALEQ
ncbi:MAG: hypothetical protein A3C22_01225 [Candidatus Levybacteria bacterium RIFCSPHIGHO2_02_FULL_37_10]|nr:MAG: hypothetical protein A3C22_01225 [Candidatus Levybacteria bacterium RIFCSPHIGHO2_02_FULL_37_10]